MSERIKAVFIIVGILGLFTKMNKIKGLKI